MTMPGVEARIRARAQLTADQTVDAAVDRVYANFARLCDPRCTVTVKGVQISVDEFLQAMRVHCKTTYGERIQQQAIDEVVANVRGTPR
jgi:hypothetical protein